MDIKSLIKDIEAFAAKHGKTPEYVCRKATRHPRLFERLQNRLEQTQADEKRIRQFMADASKPQSNAAPKPRAKQPRKSSIPPKVQA